MICPLFFLWGVASALLGKELKPVFFSGFPAGSLLFFLPVSVPVPVPVLLLLLPLLLLFCLLVPSMSFSLCFLSLFFSFLLLFSLECFHRRPFFVVSFFGVAPAATIWVGVGDGVG